MWNFVEINIEQASKMMENEFSHDDTSDAGLNEVDESIPTSFLNNQWLKDL